MLETLLSLATMAASAFLAATILPFPSEATFAGLLHREHLNPVVLLGVATIFNTLGSMVNWWVGKIIADGGIERLPDRLRPDEATLAKGEHLFHRFGWLALLFSWVPGVGDLGTIAAGLLRYPLGAFAILVGIGKCARYAAIWGGWIVIAG
ncbi:MAG: YqaA family protein [Bosea sp. (in: a-proteobacteria)]